MEGYLEANSQDKEKEFDEYKVCCIYSLYKCVIDMEDFTKL
jgi:hypothetical protein